MPQLTTGQKRWSWVLAGCAIAAAGLMTRPAERAVALSAAQAQRDAGGTAGAPKAAKATRPALDLERVVETLRARTFEPGAPTGALFSSRSWVDASRSQEGAAREALAPAAPEFPFRVLGTVALEGDPVTLVLAKADDPYPVKEGEAADGFRIERIGEEDFAVTHVPTGIRLTFRYEQLYGEAQAGSKPLAESASRRGAAAGSILDPARGIAQAAQRPVTANVKAPAATGAAAMERAAPTQGTEMVITPPAPGAEMVITPPAPGTEMVILPPRPGTEMIMIPASPGMEGPGMGSPPGSPTYSK
jgi:hypothetical protein